MRSRARSARRFLGAAPIPILIIIAASVIARNAVVGAHHHAVELPESTPKPSGAHELICDLQAHVQMLGALPEASGLALSRNTADVLWSMDDSDGPFVVPLSANGAVLGRVRITGAEVKDWEDLSIGPCDTGSCLYVGDIGNAGTKRTEVTIYRVPEPRPGDAATSPAVALNFSYPDGGHDAEASFVTPDSTLFIISKGHPTVLYRAPRGASPGQTEMLERVGELPIEGLLSDTFRKQTRITDAETSPDGQWVALRTNAELLVYRTKDLADGNSATVWHADLRPLDETQGEGVALSNSGDVYLAGEGGGHGLPGTFAHIHCALPK